MDLGYVLGMGLLLGMQHATEADHLAAVAALASREYSTRHGIYHGIAWGLGHTLTLLLATAAIGLLGFAVSPSLSRHLEQAVGLMLVILGIGVLVRIRRELPQQLHPESGSPAGADPDMPEQPRRLPWRSVFVGTVHGMAGSATLAVVAGQAMPSPGWMLAYVGVFGAGSMIGMAMLTGALSIPLTLTARRLAAVHRGLNVCVGLLSTVLGLRLVFAPI